MTVRAYLGVDAEDLRIEAGRGLGQLHLGCARVNVPLLPVGKMPFRPGHKPGERTPELAVGPRDGGPDGGVG